MVKGATPVTSAPNERRFDRGAWLTLGFALLLLLLSTAQLLYRATLPTDGWEIYTTDIEPADWVYDSNLVGASSELQADDVLLSVDGRTVNGTATNITVKPPANWQSGETVIFNIQRDGALLDIAVPVVNWTFGAFWQFNFGSLSRAISTLGFLLFLGLGWFTFWRRPEVPSARALLIFSTAVGATSISGLLPDGLSVQFNALAFYLTSYFSYLIFGTLIAPALLAFSLLFPQPKRVIQRHPWLMIIPVLLGMAVFIATLILPVLGWLATLSMFIAAIFSLIHAAITQRDAVSRAQMRWVLTGFLLGIGLFSLNFPLAFGLFTNRQLIDLISAISNLGFAVIGIFLAIAVLRYRLFDIDVIIRKTLGYAVLTGLLALLYFGLVVLLQSVFESVSGQQSPIIIVISTLVIAALFTPLRRRVQTVIDRRFFRRKYDAQQVLARFGQTARDETNMDLLTAELVQVMRETMQPEGISVWLKGSAQRGFHE